MRRFIDRATVVPASLTLLVALSPGLHAQAATLNREAANAQLPNGDNQPFGSAGYIKDSRARTGNLQANDLIGIFLAV